VDSDVQGFASSGLRPGVHVLRLAVAGSVEEFPFLAKHAAHRVATSALRATATSLTHEEADARRRRGDLEDEFARSWAHLSLRLGWSAQPGSGLEAYHYYAAGTSKKLGVRGETFFKRKSEVVEFVKRSGMQIPPSPTDLLSGWTCVVRSDPGARLQGVRDEVLAKAGGAAAAVSCVLEMQLEDAY
jgi:hypothetical protein